jgi:hypothetical protein
MNRDHSMTEIYMKQTLVNRLKSEIYLSISAGFPHLRVVKFPHQSRRLAYSLAIIISDYRHPAFYLVKDAEYVDLLPEFVLRDIPHLHNRMLLCAGAIQSDLTNICHGEDIVRLRFHETSNNIGMQVLPGMDSPYLQKL